MSFTLSTSSLSQCTWYFGLAGLDNPALISDFYPEDLPEDWRLSYYSNEFQLLLINLSDLGLANRDSQSISATQVFERLEMLADDFDDAEGEEFVCAFDLSDLGDIRQQDLLLQSLLSNALPVYGINLTKRLATAQTDTFECFFTPIQAEGRSSEHKGTDCLAIVEAEKKLEPMALRELLEKIQNYANSQNYPNMYIIFSASQHALTNCRNAQLLGSLM